MENYEGWLMRYADGALTREEREAVEAFLAVHADLREELEEVAAVSVTPVVATMPGKERLLKKVATTVVWWRVAAVVALMAVAGSTLMVLNRQGEESPLVALNREGERIDTTEAIETTDSESIQTVPSVKSTPSIPSVKSGPTISSTPSVQEAPLLAAQAEEPAVIDEEKEDPVIPAADVVVPEEAVPAIKVTYGRVINDAHLSMNVWHDVFLAAI
ncbi:MAG: hypothetical protein IJ745_03890 [Bacteroidales bacterium]|nr:hypothetical protein [Bacteroidales bacterium]